MILAGYERFLSILFNAKTAYCRRIYCARRYEFNSDRVKDMRWLLITVLALFMLSWLAPFLRRFGFGKLPGDFNFRLRGRDINIPLGSTLVLSLLFSLISYVI
jgi:Protein of unknown function (DUF2905)